MDDEFALCWNNFQDNIASGFQNLYDRGDLVDVTLACDGKLLHAHKIVLAICSPYFQEIFISNPCKHPIIILKDVTVGVMCELLQFMYQGVVNVKHTELQAFMKIAQLLQIKGLASNTSAPQKSPSQIQSASSANGSQDTATSSASTNPSHKHAANNESNSVNDSKSNVPAPSSSSSASSPSPMQFSHIKSPPENSNPFQTGPGLKRLPEYSTDSLSIYSRNKYRRNTENSDHDMGPDSLDNVNQEDNFLSTIPHISMVESRFDINSVKRENNEHTSSSSSLRNTIPPHFGFDYNLYKNNPEYPNDLHIPNDYSKSFSNHMDIPPSGGNVTMLSSTSLLHANCVFNRNNTVATQQGMKTYWLCKSYRISMCRARCITHQGRVISATGVHNHPPHMRNVGGGLDMPPQQNNPGLMVPSSAGNLVQIPTSNTNLNSTLSNIRLPQGATNLSQHNLAVMNHQQQQSTQPPPPHHHHLPQGLSSNSSHHQIHQNVPSHHHHPSQHVSSHPQSSVIQNMMHNVNLMHLSNMAPMLNTLPTQHSPQINTLHSQQQPSHHHQTHHHIPQPPSSLEITPILTESPCVNSPSNRSSNPSQGESLDSPMHSSAGQNASGSVALESPSQGSEVAPGERWFHGKLEFMLSQRGKPLLVHDGHTFGIQYVRKDKKYWQCNLSRKFNCKARVTTTETGEIIVTNNEHCHTEIRQHLRKDYQRNKVMMNALINLSTSHLTELRRQQSCSSSNNNNNNFGNINSLSSSSSNRLEKDYRSFPEVGLESIVPNSEGGKVSPPLSTENVINIANANSKKSDIPNEGSWKGKNEV